MQLRVDDLVQVFRETLEYQCAHCEHHIEDPTPLQKVEWVRAITNAEPSLVSIAYRKYKGEIDVV